MKNAFQKGTFDEGGASEAGGTYTFSCEGAAGKAIRYLLSLQNEDGGWGASKDEPSRIQMTAMALMSLRLFPVRQEDALAVNKAVAYLLSRQKGDGGFGDVLSTIHETALAYRALLGVVDDGRAIARARHYLVISQVENGSWNDDLYSTMLALEVCLLPEEGLKDPATGVVEPEADGRDEKTVPGVPGVTRSGADGLTGTEVESAATGSDGVRNASGARYQIQQRNERTKISLVSRRNASSSSGVEPWPETVTAGKAVIVQSVNTDRKKYGANETVYICSTIENRSDAVFSVLVNAQLADARGHIVDVASHDTGPTVKLGAGACETVTLLWNTGMNQPGTYGVRFHVADASNGSILDERKLTVAIEPSIAIDDLDLSVVPSHLTADETKTIQIGASLRNRSNADTAMRAEFFVKDPEDKVVHQGALDFGLPASTSNMTLELPSFVYTFDRSGQYLVEARVLSGDDLCSEVRSVIRVAAATRIEVTRSLDPATVAPDSDKRVRVGIRLEGLGAVANPSFLSAMTNTTGDRILIVFNKAMADPAGNHPLFIVTADGVPWQVNDVCLDEPDITRICLLLGTPVTKGQALLVSCAASPDLTCVEGKPLLSFHDEPVANKVSPPIFNQDGYGFSGPIPPNPLTGKTVMTGYGQWPRGFYKNVLAFAGAVFDGECIWMVPANAESVVKIDRNTGEMTAYSGWPQGFRKGNLAFAGAVFDGECIWMVPANADSVVKIDRNTGEMTSYSGWPQGFNKGGHAFAGAVFDGECIWMVPSYADSVVKLDRRNGEMTRYNQWPAGFAKGGYAFAGGIFDGRCIWMVPANADSVVKLDTQTGEMTRYNQWPAGLGKVEYAFAGGIFDGRYIWMVPYYADRVVRIDSQTGEMTGHHRRPEGLGKVEYAFAGGVFDGQGVWMIPLNADRVVRIDKDTGDVTEHSGWPQGFIKGVNAFAGGVFDGECIWMVPSYADRAVRVSSFSSLSVSANITANDAFHFYVSQDESEEGVPAGKGKGWSSVHSLNAALVPGVTNYLHVKCVDATGPVAAFIADFMLNDGNFRFADGSRHLVTSEENWRVYTDRFGGKEEPVTAVCKNGVGSWSTRFGIDLNANWVWTKRGTDRGVRCFSTPVYYAPVPVPPMEDVHIAETIAGAAVAIDEGSFTREPLSVSREGDATVARWHLEKFRVGQREDLFFDVMVQDTVPGEDRLVSHSLEMTYRDASGETVHREVGPCHVHVLHSPYALSVSTGRQIYRMGEEVIIFSSVSNLSDLGKSIDVRAVIEDSQGVLIEEILVKDVCFGPGEERNIDGLAFKLVATNEGIHRVRLILFEDLREAGEASADFTVEDIPAESVSVHGGRSKDGEVEGAVEAAGIPAAADRGHGLRLAREVEGRGVEDIYTGGTDDLEGTISAQPSPIYQGLSETVYYTVSRGANDTLAGLRVNVVIADVETGEVRQSFTPPRAHLKCGSFGGSFTFSTGTLEPGEYAAGLQISADPASEPLQIAGTSFVVRKIEVVLT